MVEILDSMILLTLILVLPTIVDMRMQPVTCNEDAHCSPGFFCHTSTHLCHECLSCDSLRRLPGPKEYDCITLQQQCGPCLQGFVNGEANWGAVCISPEVKHMKILPSYMYILLSCVASGILISLFMIHGIWNTQIIKVNIAYKTSQTPTATGSDFIKKNSNAFTA